MADREDGKDAVNYWPSVSDMFLVFFVLALCWGSTLVVKEQEGEIYAFEEVVYQANQLMSKLHNLEKKEGKYEPYRREEEGDSYKNPRAEEITLPDGSKIWTQSRCPKLAARLMNVHDRILQLHLDSTNNKHTGNLMIPCTSIMLTSDAVEQQKKIRGNTSSLAPMTAQEMLEETMQSTEYKELRARAGKNYIDAVRLLYMLVANKKEWERSASMFSNRMLSEVNARLFHGTSLVQRLEGYEGVLDKFVGQEANPDELSMRKKLDELMAFYAKYKDVDQQLEELESLRKLLAGFGGKPEETAAILAELQKLRELLAGFAGTRAEKDKILADVKAWAAQLAKHPDLEKDLQLLDQLKSLLAKAELENVSSDAELVEKLKSLLAKVKKQEKTIADKDARIAALNEKVALLENQYVAAVELDGSELVFHVNTTEIDNTGEKSKIGLDKLVTFCETLAQKLVSAESEGLVYVVEIIGHTDSDTSEFEFEPHGIGNVALGLARASKIETEITRRVRGLLGWSSEILSKYLKFHCYSASSLYPHPAGQEKSRRVELISRSEKKEQQKETKAQ